MSSCVSTCHSPQSAPSLLSQLPSYVPEFFGIQTFHSTCRCIVSHGHCSTLCKECRWYASFHPGSVWPCRVLCSSLSFLFLFRSVVCLLYSSSCVVFRSSLFPNFYRRITHRSKAVLISAALAQEFCLHILSSKTKLKDDRRSHRRYMKTGYKRVLTLQIRYEHGSTVAQ